MISEIKLNKWGNSLGLRIPSAFLEQLGLNIDSKLQMAIKDDKIIIEKQRDLAQMCDEINEYNLNIDSEWIDNSLGKEW
ncbi:AbrB/MazE/SpoVT family DNA-binding domain-containing protein [Helicobacter sp. 23-1045]